MSDLLGIMTHRIKHPDSLRRHARAAIAEQFGGVVAYTPEDVDLERGLIRGYVFRGDTWRRQTTSYPKMNMDIGFYQTPASIGKAGRVKKTKQIRFTGYGLGNKWKIQSHLLESDFLKPYLLPTEQVKTSQQFIQFLKKHGRIMLKPINGWGGRGIVKVILEEDRFTVHQNGKPTLRLPLERLGPYIRGVLKNGGRHIMQKWIDIRNQNGQVFDIRALMQKNSKGAWQLTGTAVREGRKQSITSNIKSGGSAYEAGSYLKKEFGEEKGEALTKSITEVANYIPEFTEKSYMKRLTELGIDLAVDKSGKLWLLEINIKPGRAVIRQVYGKKAWEQSFQRPFQYARDLYKKEVESLREPQKVT